jgi:hypothetical protein
MAGQGASRKLSAALDCRTVRALVLGTAVLALASPFAGAADSRTAPGLRGVVMRPDLADPPRRLV